MTHDHAPARRDPLGAIAAMLIGAAVIAYTYGLQILPPWRTGWMLRGTIGPDPVLYWLGWMYFRDDSWRLPPGLNPDYGLEIGSSIFFTDSIPLLAIPLKALHPWIVIDQYWGAWLFACGMLQAWGGFALAGFATQARLPRLAAAALFALSPTMLNRLGGHFAVGAHFLLLAGLFLYLAQLRHRTLAWVLLVMASSMIHSYLLPMVAGLWAADWARRGFAPRGLLAPAAGVLGLWLGGFFTISGGFGGTWGAWGAMQLDLLAVLDPSPWGRFLPDLPEPDHLETGHSYPGLGGLITAAIGFGLWAGRGFPGLRRHAWLVASCAAMLAFAISFRVTFGGREVLVLPMPVRVVEIASALRGSERFLWPAAYAALAASVITIIRRLGSRRAGLLLAGLTVLQAVDMAPGFARLHRYFPPEQGVVKLRLSDPFWLQAAAHYDRVRLSPTGQQPLHWEEVAVFAATCGLPTDATYLARIDPARRAALNARKLADLREGRHEPGTFYALGSAATLEAARAGMDPARDLLAQFDGIWVLAPGWHARGAPVRAACAGAGAG